MIEISKNKRAQSVKTKLKSKWKEEKGARIRGFAKSNKSFIMTMDAFKNRRIPSSKSASK